MNHKNQISEKTTSNKEVIGVVGLGYVGLPLAVEFAKKFPVVGFDINQNRVNELSSGHDSTLEVEDKNLKSVLAAQIGELEAWYQKNISFITDLKILYYTALVVLNGDKSYSFSSLKGLPEKPDFMK